MTIDFNRVAAFVRNVAAYVAMVAGSIPATDLPASVRVPLVASGGALLAVEHGLSKVLSYIDAIEAKTPSPAPAPAVPPVAPVANSQANPFGGAPS